MAISSSFFSSQPYLSLRVECSRSSSNMSSNKLICQRRAPPFQSDGLKVLGRQSIGQSFLKGSRIIGRPDLGSNIMCRKNSALYASWLPCSEIASGAFTLGTVAVLPCYTSMVVAPRSEFTKKLVGSSFPYMILGALYAYLLYLSWTPDTMRLMFASQYWLPELPGIAKMFSSEMTLASAWIHLLAVDLFAARQVYDDGLQNNIETRHSVSLCLLFCPIGILAHFITKALTRSRKAKDDEIQ